MSLQELYDQHRDLVGTLLDIRSAQEFASGHIPGAVNVPHDQLAVRLSELPVELPVTVYCAKGGRAMGAAMVLGMNGYEVRCVSPGGLLTWVERGWPVSRCDGAHQ